TAWATTELMNILLPAGTILAMSTSGWAGADTAFKNKWKVCDGTGGMPDLRYKFLRGGTATDPASGDGKKTLSIDEIPEHGHRHTHDTHTGSFGEVQGYNVRCDGVFSLTRKGDASWEDSTEYRYDVSLNAPHSYDETKTGGGEAFDVIPAFYTVIYIMKVA
ncbi:putative phage tail collar domain family protein, partial [Candidatus Termititenax aidoneus]